MRQGLVRGKIYLVIVAGNAGRSTKGTFQNLAQSHGIPCLEIHDREKLGEAVGLGPKAVLGIADQNLAAQILMIGRRLAGHSEDGCTTGVDK